MTLNCEPMASEKSILHVDFHRPLLIDLGATLHIGHAGPQIKGDFEVSSCTKMEPFRIIT